MRAQAEFDKDPATIRIVFRGVSPPEDRTLIDLGVYGESGA